MKSVGEVMAIGRTFNEALQKALRSLETGTAGWTRRSSATAIRRRVHRGRAGADPRRGEDAPRRERLSGVARGLPRGHLRREIYELVRASIPGSSREIRELVEARAEIADVSRAGRGAPAPTCASWKRLGLLRQAARGLTGAHRGGSARRSARRWACIPSSSASTPAPPSSRRTRRTSTRPTRTEDEVAARRPQEGADPRRRPEPHRPGRSSSTTAACTPSFALREAGFETIMVNCNPETVSTDYDTSRPALLRAAHPRGRAGDRAAREARSAPSCSSAGRRR